MLTDPTLTLADQLFWIVDCFCKTMAAEACKRRMGAVGVAIWSRVRRLERRFSVLYGMWRAGTLPQARVRFSAPSAVKRLDRGERRGAQRKEEALAALNAQHSRPASLLPGAFAWLYRLLPESAGTLGGGVELLLLNFPETRAFVADCPQAGRVLRPMCRMVGVKPPEWLALAKRVRKTYPSPRPTGSSPVASLCSPQSGEGEGRRRRRTAREVALAAMEKARRTGTPVDPRKIGSVAYGYVLHWPRDGNCPPPEVGYAPSRWRARVPKDYSVRLRRPPRGE